ncbi:MAG: hypothetical protein KF775_17460 [Cyclobacteriaceae bacterium]|nr:hypothetical protein [Cyclobacteriaceae bacterium]
MKRLDFFKLEKINGGDKWDSAAGVACGLTVGLFFTPLIFLSPITAVACGGLSAHALLRGF